MTIDREHLHVVARDGHLVHGAARAAAVGFGRVTAEIALAVTGTAEDLARKRAAILAHASQVGPRTSPGDVRGRLRLRVVPPHRRPGRARPPGQRPPRRALTTTDRAPTAVGRCPPRRPHVVSRRGRTDRRPARPGPRRRHARRRRAPRPCSLPSLRRAPDGPWWRSSLVHRRGGWRGVALPRVRPADGLVARAARLRAARRGLPRQASPRRLRAGRAVRAGFPAAPAALDRHLRGPGAVAGALRAEALFVGGRRRRDRGDVPAARLRRCGPPRSGSASRRCAARVPFGGFPWGRVAFGQPDGPLLPLAAVGGAPLLSFVPCFAGLALGEAGRRLRAGARSGRGRRARRARRRGPADRSAGRAGPARRRRGPAATGRSPPCRATCPASAWTSTPSAARCSTTTCASPSSSPPTSRQAAGRARTSCSGRRTPPTSTRCATPTPPPAIDRAAARRSACRSCSAPCSTGPDGRTPRQLRARLGTRGRRRRPQRQAPGAAVRGVPAVAAVLPLLSATPTGPATSSPAPAPGAVDAAGVRLGIAICCEVAFDDLVADSVDAGAQVLAVPSNNATFGLTDMTYQQLAMSPVRAVEHGRAGARGDHQRRQRDRSPPTAPSRPRPACSRRMSWSARPRCGPPLRWPIGCGRSPSGCCSRRDWPGSWQRRSRGRRRRRAGGNDDG